MAVRVRPMHVKIKKLSTLTGNPVQSYLNEAEITLPLFLDDLKTGNTKRIYQTNEFADITFSPAPDYNLINLNNYASKSIQFSRGCPFNCEFCDITALLGHRSRIKTTEQI